MAYFSALSFAHQKNTISDLSQLQIDKELCISIKNDFLKKTFNIKEFFFLNTCNRLVFFVFHEEENIDWEALLKLFLPSMQTKAWLEKADFYQHQKAVQHLFRLASSLESLVIGEREILTQIRQAFEWAQQQKWIGNYFRILIPQALQTAKKAFLLSDLGKKEVSVTSVAYKMAQKHLPKLDAKQIIAIGAGLTNQSLLKFFGYYQEHLPILIYNRTLEKASKIADKTKAKAYSLEDLISQKVKEKSILLICTGAGWLDKKKYQKIFVEAPELIIDLGVPADIDQTILRDYKGFYIGMQTIQDQIEQNLSWRKNAIPIVEKIIEEGIKTAENKWKERQKINHLENLPELLEKKTHLFFEKKYPHLQKEIEEKIGNIFWEIFKELQQEQINLILEMYKEKN